MRLSNVKRIDKADLVSAGEVPAWVDPMINTLNQFIEQATTAINGNLTFQENMLSKDYSGEFTSDVPVVVNPAIDGRQQLRVYGVIPMDTNGVKWTGLKWEKLSDGKIRVTMTFDPVTTTKCVLQILLR
jgi:hypothetical protein